MHDILKLVQNGHKYQQCWTTYRKVVMCIVINVEETALWYLDVWLVLLSGKMFFWWNLCCDLANTWSAFPLRKSSEGFVNCSSWLTRQRNRLQATKFGRNFCPIRCNIYMIAWSNCDILATGGEDRSVLIRWISGVHQASRGRRWPWWNDCRNGVPFMFSRHMMKLFSSNSGSFCFQEMCKRVYKVLS